MLIKDVYQRQAVMADRRSPPVSLRLVTEGNPHWANPGLNDGFVKLHVICEMRTEEGKSIFLQAKGAPPIAHRLCCRLLPPTVYFSNTTADESAPNSPR